MSRFIRLTKFILNTSDIHKIDILPNKYYIRIKELDGVQWRIAGSGYGSFSSTTSTIEVCEKENINDFKIVTNWISKNS